jgi:hypothetical protein
MMAYNGDYFEEIRIITENNRRKNLAHRHSQIKNHIVALKQFIYECGNKRLSNAFENFEAELTYYNYNQGILIYNPQILIDKLKD